MVEISLWIYNYTKHIRSDFRHSKCENKDNTINLYNYVILYTKHYILYHQKQQKDLQLYNILLLIKQELGLKLVTHAENNQLHKFNKIWGELHDNI